MGGVCASCMAPPEPETNPGGGKKDLQTKAQLSQDAPDLRRAARVCDLEQMLILLERMPVAQINSGTGKTESTSDELGMTALHLSAAANHLRGCKRLLLYGAHVNCRDACGRSPLHVVLENGRSKVSSFLLDQGANRNMQDKNGCCPLMSALLSGNKGTVNWFLDKTDNVSPRLNLTLVDKEGNTCILVAAMYGWWDVVDKLLGMMLALPSTFEGADTWDFKYKAAKTLSTRNKHGDTLLGWVLKFVLSGGLALDTAIPLVKHLLSVGANASTPCFKENCTLLNLAAAIGHRELFDIILEASGPSTLMAKDGLKRTALHFAAAKGHLELVKFLLGNGLRVDKMDSNKDTPLHLAAMRGHGEVCNELLTAAAALKKEDPESDMEPVEMVLLQPNASGSAVLHMALKAGPLPQAQAAALGCLRHLKPAQVQNAQMHARKKIAGVSVVEKEKVTETPLLLAVRSHAHAVVKHLLEDTVKVSVNESNAVGETAMLRCLSGVTRQTAALDAAIFKLLIDSGADVATISGSTNNHPLLALCKNDCNAFAALALGSLTQSGNFEGTMLDWSVKDGRTGRMPVHEASLHNNVFMVRCALDSTKGEHLESKCSAGLVPLAYAAWGCSVDCMKVLLNRGASPSALDSAGQSLLSYCMRLDKPESLECAALLLRSGVKPTDAVDVAGEGLLFRAVRYGACDFIRLWFCCGGNMGIKCSTKDENEACNVPTSLSLDPVLANLATGDHAEKHREEEVDLIDQEVEPLEIDIDKDGETTDEEELEAPNAGLAPLKTKEITSLTAESGSKQSPSHLLLSSSPSPRMQPASPALIAAARSLHEPTLEGNEELSEDASHSRSDNGLQEIRKMKQALEEREQKHRAKKNQVEEELKRPALEEQSLSKRSKSFASSEESSGLGAGQIGLPPPPLSVLGSQCDTPKELQSRKGPVGEACEEYDLIDWWTEDESKGGSGDVRAPSFYMGPSLQQRQEWKMQGTKWWDEWFTINNGLWENDWEEEGREEEEEWELEIKDGLLDLDDLLLEIIDREKCGKSSEPGAICEGVLKSVSSRGAPAEGTNVMKSMKEQRDKERDFSAGSGSPKLGKMTSFNSAGSSSAADSLYGTKGKEASPSFKNKMAEMKAKTPSAGKLFKSFRESGADVGKSEFVIPSYDKNPDIDDLEEHNQEKARQLVSALFSKMYAKDKVDITDDAFYNPSAPYSGEPACMKADVSEMIEVRIQDLVDSMYKRVENHKKAIQDETPLQGAELCARNLECWINSLSPDEYPLKLGGWKQLPKLRRRAVSKAKERVNSIVTSSKKKGFGIQNKNSNRMPALPTRPKHESNTALIYAVRLCRPSCVRAMLDAVQGSCNSLIDAEDLFGHTALEYALFQLAKDRLNTQMQAIADMLLISRPIVKEGNFATHNPMQPLIMAVIAYDLPRIAWLVRKCAAPVQASWIYGPDIPAYFCSQWEQQLAPLNGAFGAIHIAVLHKRLDVCKLLLELGSSPNEHAWGVDTGSQSKSSPLALRLQFLKSLRKGRKEGRPDDDAILARKQAKLHVQAKALDFVQNQKSISQFFIKKQQDIGHQYAAGRAEGGLLGDAQKLVAGANTALLGLASKLRLMVANLMHGPDVWISPLHIAARFGADDVCLLLLSRGAAVNGGRAALLARKNPLEEALAFARANFRYDNRNALMHNWEAIRLRAEAKIPDMNIAAKGRQIGGTLSMISGVVQGDLIKPVILAAKVVISMIMNALKRQVAHYDPALRSAHVILRHSAPLKLDDAVTHGIVKDMMNNGTWAWLGGPIADIKDADWLEATDQQLGQIAADTNLFAAGLQTDPVEYNKSVKAYMNQVELNFFKHGAQGFMDVLLREAQGKAQQLPSMYKALTARAFDVYRTARKEHELVKMVQMLQGLEYQSRIMLEARSQQVRTSGAKFLEISAEEDSALGMAGFNLEDHNEFLGGAYGALMSGGLSASRGTGSMQRSASLKMTQSFSKQSVAANSNHFEVPKTVPELQLSRNPLGTAAAEAAREALSDPLAFLKEVQRQAPPQDLPAILKRKLQKAQEDFKRVVDHEVDVDSLDLAFAAEEDFLKSASQADKESAKTMEDEVSIDSLARICAGAEFKVFISTLIQVITTVAPALSSLCEDV